MMTTINNNQSTPFNFPQFESRPIVQTALMLEVESRILAVHQECGFVVCYGSAGAGKTTFAEWVADRCNKSFSPDNSFAFKAVFYEAAKIRSGWGNEAKRALRSLYVAVSKMPLDEGVYGRFTTEELADLTLTVMQRNRIQLVFVDEAGLLSLEAINGLIILSNKARSRKFFVTIVLIGMDDLPQKLDVYKRPQNERRIHDWCYFNQYTMQETETLLRAIHPHFAGLDNRITADFDQINFVHSISGGLPGFITQFVSRFDAQYKNADPGSVNLLFLQAVHIRTLQSKQMIVNQAKNKGITVPRIKRKK